MDANFDYTSSFKSISLKLKKRFLRKPNVSDAIDEYTALARKLENEECFSLAANCMQQVAKSYHSVGNTILESSALQLAGKHYLTSEITSSIESGAVTFNEDLLSAISCFDEAIKLHVEQNERQLAAILCLQLGDILARQFQRHFESIQYYEKAISLFSTTSNQVESTFPIQAFFIQFKLAALKVFTCDYQAALNTYTDITSSLMSKFAQCKETLVVYTKPSGVFAKLLVDADIAKLLLLLYLKPTKLKQEHTTTLEVYSWFQTLTSNSSTYLPVNCMDRDLFILLQSFVMACQSNDAKLLYVLETELMPFLNHVQNYLLSLITGKLLDSSYTDDLLFE